MGKTKAIKPKEKRTIVSNKKKDRDQFIKEMDMLRLKQKINEIMKKVSNDKSKIENDNIKYKKNIELLNEKYTNNSNILYQSMLQKYMKEEFTLICASFANKIIIDIKKNHLEQYEGKFNFNKILISLAKELLLNEFELILVSLYLDYIDITSYLDIFNMEDSFLYLCFFIKKLTINNEELEPIISYLSKKYNNFIQNFDNWCKIIEKKINNKSFNYLEINQRFKEYNAPFNAYCSNNYIDYNYIVDRILTMSLPYVDVKKDNNSTLNNNLNNNTFVDDNNKSISIKEDNKNDNGNEINNNYINNNYINNNYINNNFINNNKININAEDYKNYNKPLMHQEPFMDIGSKPKINPSLSQNIKTESSNISNFNLLNKNEINYMKDNNKNKFILKNPPSGVTPNNLLHSLGNINRYIIAPGNNKMLINPNIINNMNTKNSLEFPINNYIDINKPNIINSSRQIDEDFCPKKMGSNLIMNSMQTPSQSSFIFQQKPSLMEMNIFNRNNSSHIFDDEGETLKQILGASSEKYFRSSMSFDSPKYPYGAFINTGNNNIGNLNNTGNNNISEQKSGDIKRKYNNEIPFRPLNMNSNKNFGNNILTQNKNIFSDYGNSNNINYENRQNETDNIKKNNN